jgi:hypothetical protein
MGRNTKQYLIFESLDDIGQMTLLADTEISSLEKPTDGVGMWVRCHWKDQSLDDLYRNQVLLTTIVDNEMNQSPLDPHSGVKEAFPFLWSFWISRLNFGGSDNGIGFNIDNLLPSFRI